MAPSFDELLKQPGAQPIGATAPSFDELAKQGVAIEAAPAPPQAESTFEAIKRNATGLVRGAEQGATFGLADELGAYGQGVIDLALRTQPKVVSDLLGVETRHREPFTLKKTMEQYRQARGENREEYKRAEAAAPTANLIGQLAGGFAMPIPGGGARTLGKVALQGAGMGAAMGVGAGEADLTKGEFGKFGTEVALGGALGGAFGAGGHVLGKALAAGGGKLRDFAAGKAQKIQGEVEEWAAKEAEKATLSARSAAGNAAQDAYRQLEHLRELGRTRGLTAEERAVFDALSRELGDKAQEKLLPAAMRKASTADEFANAVATQEARAADLAKQKLSTGELKNQTLARLKRYGLPALGGYVGSQVFEDTGLGAGAGALVGAGLRPMLQSTLKMARQPVVQQRLWKALEKAGRSVGGKAPPATPMGEAIEQANRTGLLKSEHMRDGMRSLDPFNKAYEGATAAEARAIATGAAPAKNSGKVFDPVTVVVEDGQVLLRDGRHRMTAASQAGADRVRANVVAYPGGKKTMEEALISLHPERQQLPVSFTAPMQRALNPLIGHAVQSLPAPTPEEERTRLLVEALRTANR